MAQDEKKEEATENKKEENGNTEVAKPIQKVAQDKEGVEPRKKIFEESPAIKEIPTDPKIVMLQLNKDSAISRLELQAKEYNSKLHTLQKTYHSYILSTNDFRRNLCHSLSKAILNFNKEQYDIYQKYNTTSKDLLDNEQLTNTEGYKELLCMEGIIPPPFDIEDCIEQG